MSTDATDFDRRLATHAALADPARLRVVDRLALGDLAPSEIQEALGMGSNLLAHHLGVLEDAGLIRRARSEADGRRVYVRLTDAGRGLASAATLPAPRRILFVCTGNSARSQLAAAMWQRESAIPAASAGTRPASAVARGAMAVAARRGLEFIGGTPTAVADVLRDDDWVISVCDAAHETLAGRDAAHWSVPDPVRAGSGAAFDLAFDELAERVRELAPQFQQERIPT